MSPKFTPRDYFLFSVGGMKGIFSPAKLSNKGTVSGIVGSAGH